MEDKKGGLEKLLEKIKDFNQKKDIDLSSEEDLSIAIMNLISLEEHFFFTASRTEDPSYYNLLDETRSLRKELLARMIEKHEGETWCAAKHLLAATMRLMEVGTKLYSDGKKEEAQKIFSYAYKLYSLFWGLKLKLINITDIKKVAKEDKAWSLEDIVNKLVDCCDE
ncbi:MAG: hypothetical protein KY053_00330 [Candidatus Liptonbacteria bacterium]|nr:hypothetical protein [Candidatus Liptonbacteria bacterium]